MCFIIPEEDSKVGRVSISRDELQRKGAIHSINSGNNGLEVIMMFEAGYPNLNIRKDECKQ